ncbi:MAG: hypothetical protein ACKPDI_02140 [Actinomycetota bacterium]
MSTLKEHRLVRPAAAVAERFFAISGLDLGSFIALELFTTVLPIMLLGYGRLSDFSHDVSMGQLFVDMVGATGRDVVRIQREFGKASGILKTWTPFGVAGFLVWGIPMSLTVCRMYAAAWKRPQYSAMQRIWRGAVWFVIYLVVAGVNEDLLHLSHQPLLRIVLLLAAVGVSTVFWGLTPALLVPSVRLSRRLIVEAGLVGAIMHIVILRFAVRMVFPMLLSGWDGFGPIGVAFTIMTWCGALGVVWVAVACAGAVISERAWRPT